MTKTFFKSVILTTLLLSGTSAMAKELVCYSGKNAPRFHTGTGQWTLKANVHSKWTLKDAVLKNKSKKDLGSETKRVTYDKRTTDARVFTVNQDVFCKYEVIVPRDWDTSPSFVAELDMTCDEMYDATARLNCSVR